MFVIMLRINSHCALSPFHILKNLSLQKLPDLHLNDMSLICRTFSLATLRNIFPDASSWRASHPTHSNQARGADSNQTASPYVQIYIGTKN